MVVDNMYNVTIVGGGNISSGFDFLKSKKILTHIHGCLKHPKIVLDAVIEKKIEKHRLIREKWGKRFRIFSNVQECLCSFKSDIIIIATPTPTHLNIIEKIFKIYQPKMILCEKPIVSDIKEYNYLIKILENKTTKLIVNFIRRFDPSLNKLKEIINNRCQINHFYGNFAKGLIYNGSHMIDLIFMLIGNIEEVKAIEKKIVNKDIFGKFFVKTNCCTGIITNVNYEKNLSLFDLSIYADELKIDVTTSNQDIVLNYLTDSNTFHDYYTFSKTVKLPRTIDNYGYNTLEYLIKILENKYSYKEIKNEQEQVNKFIFLLKQKLME